MQKIPDIRGLTISAFVLLASIVAVPADATDFFLRPTHLSMVEDWTPQLSFFVSNPSDRTIVLQVETRQTRAVLAAVKPEEVALKALPAQIVLKAGERKIIRLEYDPRVDHAANHYEVVVEQLPIIYLRPGDEAMPDTMLVTRYVADVEVRLRSSRKQYAMTGFDRNFETSQTKRAGSRNP